MRHICRSPLSSKEDPEDLMRLFLIESFDTKFVLIISPWISPFRFSKKIIYYPYVSTYNVTDVLKALSDEGVNVKMLIRCFDDFISPDFIFTLYSTYSLISTGKMTLPSRVSEYLKNQLSFALSRLEASEKLVNIGIDVKSDLGINDRTIYRLHAKVYVNDKMALIGSANFTRSGIVRGGNWECLLLISANDDIYNEVLREAKNLFEAGKDFSECEVRMVRLINEVLQPYGTRIRDLDDLKVLLKDMYSML